MHLGQKRESPALRAGLSPEIQVCRKKIQIGILNQGPILHQGYRRWQRSVNTYVSNLMTFSLYQIRDTRYSSKELYDHTEARVCRPFELLGINHQGTYMPQFHSEKLSFGQVRPQRAHDGPAI
jgi:hypothetical protein